MDECSISMFILYLILVAFNFCVLIRVCEINKV